MAEDTRGEAGSGAAGTDAAHGPIVDDGGSVVSDEIAALQSQLADAAEKQLRLAADFDNYRKRMERDRADQVARAQTSLIRRLLDVLDDLERVTQHADATVSAQALAQGVDMVERKFRQVLESAGVEQVASENAPFDPQTMEAVATVAAESAAEDDTVSDVFQKGYRVNGVLVRPAQVRVRKHE